MSHLRPQARLRLDHGGVEVPEREPYTAGQERPEWVALLNGDHDPHMTDPRVPGFRHEQMKPFHPARRQHVLDEHVEPGEFGTVVRSAGICRLATHPHVVGEWEHVGRMFSLEPLAFEAPAAEDPANDDHEPLALG